MRFWRIYLAVLIAVVNSAAPVVAQGPSSLRQLVELSDQNDWLAVGRLNVTGQGFCTATLVAPDLVLTAAHCIVDKRTQRVVSPDRVHFLPGFRKGVYAGHGIASELSVVRGFDRERQTLSRDIALIRLVDPFEDSVTPMTLLSNAQVGDPVAAVSYSIDRSQIQSHQPDCSVLRLQGRVLFTSCEGVPGVSGAPIFTIQNGQPRLVAVASSVASRGNKKVPRGNLLAVVPTPSVMAQLLEDLELAAIVTKQGNL